MKAIKHRCKGCGKEKVFRADQVFCSQECARKPAKELKEINEVSGDRWTIFLPKARICTLEQLVEFCQIDLTIWEVERFIANKWEVGAKNDTGGSIAVEPLFQIKAFLRKKTAIVALRKEVEELKELAKSNARIPVTLKKKSGLHGNMLELDISDHHFGKLAWGAETGHQNYDTKIATQVFNRAVDVILERTASLAFDEIWFVVGNDLFNSDDTEGRTTKGTYVSTDVRYHKTFAVVRTAIIGTIERLRPLAKKVRVIMVYGNHDRLSVWHLGDSLECYFHKYPDVVIDNSPRYYKYHRFGDVMIMYTHGDKGKRTDYPLLMATEQPVMFGETKFREAHTGHNHVRRVDEQHGVIVRILSSLGPPDAWHAENGFVGNLRSAEGFIWNKNEGLIGTVIYTDPNESIEPASETVKPEGK